MSDFDVELSGVVKRFGSFVAVDGIDLLVQRGRFVTLLGPSGCGKTTTLRMIGGFELPDAGTIRVAGAPLAADIGAARPTRMVFQNYALFPHMTVAQNIAFGLRMQKLAAADIDRRVADIAALLGLDTQLPKYPRQLSGGQQQRVALARALVTRPRVLLLDEPLGALDLKMRKHMQNELKKLQRDVGITFVYVTHDQEEAMFLSDSVVVMDRGRIVQRGSPAEIYQHPATAYVADFIGEANLLPAMIEAIEGRSVRVKCVLGEVVGVLPEDFNPAAGDRVLVCMRPERATLAGARGDLGGVCSGTVEDAAYLGGASRISVNVGDATIRVDLPGVFDGIRHQQIAVGWAVDDIRILPFDVRFGEA